jgi:transposase
MSLHPQPIPPIPEETVLVAVAAFPKGNLYLRLRDELGVFYQDCDFDNLYSVNGQPGYAPWRLAMVLVMQFLENLSDRQAAEAVRGRMDWKYALSLKLTDPDGKRVENIRLPRQKDERNALAVTVGQDGFDLLEAIYASTAPIELRWLKAVEILRQVWLQQYYAPTPKIQLRSEKDGPPSAIRIPSPYETEARNSTKRSTNWTGYKVHLTETREENLPHLITSVETTPATTQDQQVVTSIHQSLADQNLLPNQHLVDRGYTSARLMTQSESDYQIDLFGPVGINGGWQARAGQGFDLSHFQIDWNKRKVCCPQGKKSRSWKKGKDSYGNGIIHVEFRQNECKDCPVRSLCTRAPIHARGITLLPQLEYETRQKARQRQETEEFKNTYSRWQLSMKYMGLV